MPTVRVGDPGVACNDQRVDSLGSSASEHRIGGLLRADRVLTTLIADKDSSADCGYYVWPRLDAFWTLSGTSQDAMRGPADVGKADVRIRGLRVEAGVYAQNCAGNQTGRRASQESDCAGDFMGLAEAPKRGEAPLIVSILPIGGVHFRVS